MARLVIENLDDDTMAKLRRRAKRHSCSVDEEISDILRQAVASERAARAPRQGTLAEFFARSPLRGSDLKIKLRRERPRKPF